MKKVTDDSEAVRGEAAKINSFILTPRVRSPFNLQLGVYAIAPQLD